MSLAAALLVLALPARAADNQVAERVDKELTQPVLQEVSKAAKDPAHQPTWGAWATMPQTPGVRRILKFFDEELVQPIFKSANAPGAASALASADPHATAEQGAAPQQDVLLDKIKRLLGFGTADPLVLDLAPNQVVGKRVAPPAPPPDDSTRLVRKRK